MLRRTLIALTTALAVAGPALAQAPGAAPAATPVPAKPNPRVKIETPEGAIVVELYADKAPITVEARIKVLPDSQPDAFNLVANDTLGDMAL